MKNIKTNKYSIIVCIAILLYVTIMGWACHAKYNSYGYDDFDLAVHAQSTWNILHNSMQCSIIGIPFLGNHMVLILFLIAPLYAIFPSALLLLYIQTIVLSAGAWGIYLLARRELSNTWGAMLAVTYLIYPPLIYMNLYEFHPIALASTFLIYAMFFHNTERLRPFLLCIGLAMLCQENVAMIAFGFGVYSLIHKRNWKWVVIPAASGIIFFLTTVCIIMPALNKDTIQFLRIYSQFGDTPAEIIKTILMHPIKTLAFAFGSEKRNFFNAILAPLGYLSLAGPLALIPVAPVALQRMLSGRLSETVMIYHYQAEFIPFIFTSCIYGIKNLLRCKYKIIRPATATILSFFAISALFFTGITTQVAFDISSALKRPAISHAADTAIARIPPQAAVLSTFSFLAKLSNRQEIHSLHHVYYGRHSLSDVPYPQPKNIDYIVMDTNDRITFRGTAFHTPNSYKNIQKVMAGSKWKVASHLNSLLILQKSNIPNQPPLDILVEISTEKTMSTNITQSEGADIKLLGFNIDAPNAENNATLTLFWRKEEISTKDYNIFATIKEDTSETTIYAGALSPGSRIWPPQSWTPGKIIADKHRIHLTQSSSGNNTQVDIQLFRFN